MALGFCCERQHQGLIFSLQTTKLLNEQQFAQFAQAILPVLSRSAASQVRRVMAGESDTLTFVAHLEVAGLITGYLKNVSLL